MANSTKKKHKHGLLHAIATTDMSESYAVVQRRKAYKRHKKQLKRSRRRAAVLVIAASAGKACRSLLDK